MENLHIVLMLRPLKKVFALPTTFCVCLEKTTSVTYPQLSWTKSPVIQWFGNGVWHKLALFETQNCSSLVPAKSYTETHAYPLPHWTLLQGQELSELMSNIIDSCKNLRKPALQMVSKWALTKRNDCLCFLFYDISHTCFQNNPTHIF